MFAVLEVSFESIQESCGVQLECPDFLPLKLFAWSGCMARHKSYCQVSS